MLGREVDLERVDVGVERDGAAELSRRGPVDGQGVVKAPADGVDGGGVWIGVGADEPDWTGVGEAVGLRLLGFFRAGLEVTDVDMGLRSLLERVLRGWSVRCPSW